MDLYKCVVYDKNKKRRTIKINLESKNHINEYARENDIKIVKIKNISRKITREKIKDKELKIICKEMSILLESGCEITKLLTILKKESSKKISRLIYQIHNQIKNGNSISESFSNTKLFSDFFISMIRAGEMSGSLDIVMDSLANYYEKEDKLKSKVTTILIYPIMLLIVSIAVTTFIMVAIIPNFAMVFENNSVTPPLLTKILIDISVFIKDKYLYIIFGSVILMVILFYLIKTNQNLKYKINTIKFKIPVIKNITKLIITTKFSRALYILNSSGIQIISAIDVAANVVDNEYAYEHINIAIEYIKRGNPIGQSLELANIFPKLFISMVNIGEESGKLDSTLNTINKFYENELEAKIQKFTSMIEPFVIVFLGILIGALIISMVAPMFDVVNAI